MKAKRFAHFLSHWHQVAAVGNAAPAPASPRVKAAKASLRACLSSGRSGRGVPLARV